MLSPHHPEAPVLRTLEALSVGGHYLDGVLAIGELAAMANQLIAHRVVCESLGASVHEELDVALGEVRFSITYHRADERGTVVSPTRGLHRAYSRRCILVRRTGTVDHVLDLVDGLSIPVT